MWDDVQLHIPATQTPFNLGVLKGVIEWYMATHRGHRPMAIRLTPRHWGKVAPSLRRHCDQWYGVPILPEGGFQNEDEREAEWVP